MQIKHLFKTSYMGLRTNMVRSLLTILGIVIGISAIILIFSLGKGAENLIMGELSGMGTDTIVIRPGQQPKGLSDITDALFLDSLTTEDVEALKRKSNVPYLAEIAPAVMVPGTASYRGETFKATNFGWSAELMVKMFGAELESGVLFDDIDIKNKASVAVIGSKVKEELFGNEENVIGKNIKIKGRNFRVIGVMSSRGQVSSFNVDEIIVIPYSTAQVYLLGINHYHEIILKVTSAEFVNQTVQDIKDTLRERHDITDITKDDFFVVTPEGMLDQISTILDALTLFLSAVVGISLVVGGVGVMNIMLVSVTERTKEIGLRKAIGATNKDVMVQFLFEAIILTITGGIVGVLLGAGLATLITFGLNLAGYTWSFSFPLGAAILGLVFSITIGLIFGIYPARKASQKSPIEALKR